MSVLRGWHSRSSLAGTTLATVVALAALASPAGAQTDLIAFGDSITAGTGDTEPEGQNAGYPVRVRRLIPSLTILNSGVPGEKTFEALDRIDDVLVAGGDALLLMEGSNDLSRSTPIESTIFNLAEIAERAEEANFEVIHATVIPRLPSARTDGGNVLNRQLNQGIRDLAGRRGRRLVDNFETFSQLPNLFVQYYWDNPDDPVGHPNPQGYDVMARSFADVLTGVDSVPPVAGILFPEFGQDEVSRSASISVELWDFGAGIDIPSSFLVVDGVLTSAVPSGTARGITFFYDPPQQLSGVVEVVVRARDQANPPNEVARVFSRFAVIGSEFLPGDFDASGTVDDIDLVLLSATFGARVGETRFSPDADLDGNGLVDGVDLAILASNYGI
jgi:lysophospholipase L1-like esterase